VPKGMKEIHGLKLVAQYHDKYCQLFSQFDFAQKKKGRIIMIKFAIFVLFILSTQAFANVCEVDMVDNYSGRILNRFREYDYDGTCREAMKECRKQIRLSGWYGRADCRISRVERPYPNPDYNGQATRPIQVGEVVIFRNQFATVTNIDRGNLYSIQFKDNWRTTHHQIPREYLAVTNGCVRSEFEDLCTGHQVVTRDNQYGVVVGLHFNQKVVLRMNHRKEFLESNVDPFELDITR